MTALTQWLRDELGLEEPITVTRIGTGHSRAMSVAADRDGRRVVVRAEQGGVFGTSGAEECRVMRALHAAGYPVARILAEERTGSVADHPFFVMEFVEGADVEDERAVDSTTAAEFVRTLHALHQLDGSTFGFDIVPSDPSEATPLQIERWRDVYRGAWWQ